MTDPFDEIADIRSHRAVLGGPAALVELNVWAASPRSPTA